MELLLAHVHRIHLRRAVLQQAVRKPASGSPGVQTDEPGHIQLEMLYGGQQLIRATADVFLNADQCEGRIQRIFVTGLIHFLPHAGNIFQRHFARHDQAFRHFAAFRQTLAPKTNSSARSLPCAILPPLPKKSPRYRGTALELAKSSHDATHCTRSAQHSRLKDTASFVMLPSSPFPLPVYGTADTTDFRGSL